MTLVITAQRLSTEYLNGMPLPDSKGRPMSPEAMEAKIKSTTAAFQRRYNLRLTPTLVRLGEADLPGAPAPTPELPLITRDAPEFVPHAWERSRHASIKLPVGPIKRVHAVGLKLPGQAHMLSLIHI